MIVDKCEVKTARTWPYKRYSVFENELRAAAVRWFKNHKSKTHPKMDYCLKAHDCWPQNIIRDDVVEYIKKERERYLGKDFFTLHKYFHHGLSSQAMIFNLIGPLVVREDFEPLKIVFEESDILWPQGNIDVEFEYDDRSVFNETTGQPTSIDVVFRGINSSLFIEAKLAEKEFGGCSIFKGGDCEGMNPNRNELANCYLHHIGRKYWDKLQEHDFIGSVFENSPICPLANYYQFFREVLFALDQRGKFILLHDDRNPAFIRKSDNGKPDRGLWPFLMQFVPKHHHNNLARITIQQVVKAIEKSGGHNDWIGDFKEKYGLNVI